MDCTMTKMAKNRISEEEDNNRIPSIDPENRYIKSYPYLLEATKLLHKELGADSIIAISHIAYGWMPTILTYDFSKHDGNILDEAQSVKSFEEARTMIGKIDLSPVNNSWVGLSKVLHFANPEFFPIWDSKVAKHFGVSNQMGKRQNYIDYISFVESQLERKIVLDVQKEFKKQTGREVSKARACEFILFSFGAESAA